MIYIPGKHNLGADAISRYPCQDRTEQDKIDTERIDHEILSTAVSFLSVDNIVAVTLETVGEETLKDTKMMKLMSLIHEGFPDKIEEIPTDMKEFHKFRDHLSVVQDLILYKNRIMIPYTLQYTILRNLHSAHQGVTSMISRAESSVFWPGITNDIRKVREQCEECIKMAPSQPNAPPTPITYAAYPFQLICADYFSHRGVNYLVIVDRYSNWPTVIRAKDGGNAKQLIEALKEFCEAFGITEEISSVEGHQFSFGKMRRFAADWGIKQIISSTAFPHSNSAPI